jgi:hypothetical protein
MTSGKRFGLIKLWFMTPYSLIGECEGFGKECYLVFRTQADWTLTHRSFYHNRRRNTDWLTDQVITEYMTFSLHGDTSVCR